MILTSLPALLVLATGAAGAGLTEDQCHAEKVRAAGSLLACRANRAAQAIAGGSADPTPCESRFHAALVRLDARAERSGISCRFRNLGDGTVLDLDTGLQWEQKQHLDGVPNFADPHDADNFYSWTHDPVVDPDAGDGGSTSPSGTAFTDFLAALNTCVVADRSPPVVVAAGFAGHCDWRLPVLDELLGIVDVTAPGCGSSGPCIDERFGPTPRLGTYWSLTSGPVTTNAWELEFGSGLPYVDDEDSKRGHRYVRAVRGGW